MSTQYFNIKKLHGKVTGDTYHKQVSGSVHMLRKPPAWALDVCDLAEAVRRGATRVSIHDQDTGTTYAANVALIYERGFEFNRGYGKQIALPLQFWGIHEELKTGGINPVKSGKVERPAARQLALFGEVRR